MEWRLGFLFLTFIICRKGFAIPSDTVYLKHCRSKLAPSVQRFIQYKETKDGLIQFNALLTRSIQSIPYKGKAAWLIVQQYQTAQYIDRDSSFCDAETLLPLAYFTDVASSQQKECVTFDSGVAKNVVLYKDSVRQFLKVVTGFYNGVMVDDIIRLLPLWKGGRFVLKTLNPGANYQEYATVIHVEGKEQVLMGDGRKAVCWRVRVSAGVSDTIEWYTVKDPKQVKKKFVLKNGSVFYRLCVSG